MIENVSLVIGIYFLTVFLGIIGKQINRDKDNLFCLYQSRNKDSITTIRDVSM